MNDDGRMKAELLTEIEELRRQVQQLEKLEAELEQALSDLRVSEANYRSIFEAANDAIYVHDAETGAILDVNARMLEMFGYNKDEVLCKLPGDEYLAGMPPFTADNVLLMVKKAAAAAQPLLFEWLAKHKLGRLFWVEVNLKFAIIGGQPRLLAIVRDIDERKRAENALRESEEQYRSLLEAVDDSISIKDAQGRYLMVNPEFCRRMERSRAEILGKTVRDLYEPEPARQVERSDWEVLEKGRTVDTEEYHPRRRRAKVTHVRKVPLWSAAGDVVGVVTVARDITERKRLEEQLLRAQRLETAGRVAGQVAHDFNNLLSPLTAYPELIKMQLPGDHPTRAYCDAMMEAAERMASINEDMLALGRRGLFDVEPIDLNRLIKQAVGQVDGKPSSLAIHLDLGSDLLPVAGSPAQLMRVITNLLTNAREAMEDNGVITAKTENVYIDQPLTGFNRIAMGEYVRLTVADTGCGIPHEMLNKIFEAFFTTKTGTKRRGCGLGLSIVQSIVEDHKGYIDLESEVGKGTTFRIYLPISREPVCEKVTKQLQGGNESLLVIDDDQLQREVMVAMLRCLGYQVESVASGEDALKKLDGHMVDLLILDMVMPGSMDGAETYRRVQQLRPRQRAIVVSGFAKSERVQEAQALGIGAFLSKPVRMEDLARVVREELSRG